MSKVRKNIESLTPKELEEYRKAVRTIQAGKENGLYFKIASLHGETENLCTHHLPAFLFWHRLYMIAYERALQTVNPNVTLPYWDWESEAIPKAFSDQTCVIDGVEGPNPLYSYTIPSSVPLRGWPATTYREPNLNITRFQTWVRTCFSFREFQGFAFCSRQGSIEGVHDQLHLSVGGHMSDPGYAAFDPIFYAHHANVDRLFASYQALFNATNIDPTPEYSEFKPFGGPDAPGKVLDYKNFYTYEKLRSSPRALLNLAGTQPFAHMDALHVGAIHDLSLDDVKKNVSHVVSFVWKKKSVSGTLYVYLNLPNGRRPEEASELLGGSAAVFARQVHCPNCDEVGEYQMDVDITLAYKNLGLTSKPEISYFFYDNHKQLVDPRAAGWVSGPTLSTVTHTA